MRISDWSSDVCSSDLSACGLPDFQKLGIEEHARMVLRLWRHLSEGNGHIPQDWFAQQVARLDTVQGDIDTLAARIAAARTWSYIANRRSEERSVGKECVITCRYRW